MCQRTGHSLDNCVLRASSLEDFVTLSVMERESACFPAGAPVDWMGLAGRLAGSQYRCPLARLSAPLTWT